MFAFVGGRGGKADVKEDVEATGLLPPEALIFSSTSLGRTYTPAFFSVCAPPPSFFGVSFTAFPPTPPPPPFVGLGADFLKGNGTGTGFLAAVTVVVLVDGALALATAALRGGVVSESTSPSSGVDGLALLVGLDGPAGGEGGGRLMRRAIPKNPSGVEAKDSSRSN